jgi:hypothetical protein
MPWSRILLHMALILGAVGMFAIVAIVARDMYDYWPSAATADERQLIAASARIVQHDNSPAAGHPPCLSSLATPDSFDGSEVRDWSGSGTYSGEQLHDISKHIAGRPVMLAVDSTPPALMWWQIWQIGSCDLVAVLKTPRIKGDLAFVAVEYTGMFHRILVWRRHGTRWELSGQVNYDTRPIY